MNTSRVPANSSKAAINGARASRIPAASRTIAIGPIVPTRKAIRPQAKPVRSAKAIPREISP